MIHPRYTRDLEADFPAVKVAADHLRALVLEHQRRGGGPLVPRWRTFGAAGNHRGRGSA